MAQVPMPAHWQRSGKMVPRDEEHYRVLSPQGEGYRLNVTTDCVSIEADGPEGLYYARQFLDQVEDEHGRIPCGTVTDAPRYKWRGLMLDVSRHYMPLDSIRRQVALMSRYRLNRLHLHLTDAAGWRLQVKAFPRLTSQGVFRTAPLWKEWWNDGRRRYATEGDTASYGGYYTQEEMRSLVRYARQHCVTIVPEIEFPAHSEEVFVAYPHLCCTGKPYTAADFCLGNEDTYRFMASVLKEVCDIFPSEYIHVGGDEAGGAHWLSCPRCRALMQREGLNSKVELQAYAMRRIQGILDSLGRKMIAWDEVLAEERFSREAPPAVMVWRHERFADSCAQRRLPVIYAVGHSLYLDKYQDAPLSQPEAIGGYLPLRQVYGCRPPQQGVMGLQANLWTEYVPTMSHAEYMLWPRALAVAELAWTPSERLCWDDFARRVQREVTWQKNQGYNPFDPVKERGQLPSYLPRHYLSYGKPVRYNRPYHPAYPADGDATLTDGLCGGWSNTDGHWQGFLAPNGVDVTIDLGHRRRLHRVSLRFMQSVGAEIYIPREVSVSVSADGTAFTPLGNVAPVQDEAPMRYEVITVRGKVRARYVRVEARPSVRGGWLFTDEVVVE